nr:hypothetical protein [Mesorhizobium sp.]
MGMMRVRRLLSPDPQGAAFEIDIGHLEANGFSKPQAGAIEHKNKPAEH